jgi:hypothetical protein
MNPCRKYRKPLALFAIDALDSSQTEQLLAHLRQCEGCRRYRQEISLITQRLSSLESLANPAADVPGRARSPLRAVRAVGQRTAGPASHDLPGWRTALPALCAIALLALVLSALVRHPAVLTPVPKQVATTAVANPPADFAPTIANYRAVANRSLEELDDLLARQARRPVPTPPAFSGTALALLSGGD